MFAEELAGNPAKKRADEAKARRLRAKKEKEAKDARKKKEAERRDAAAAAAAAAVCGTSNSDCKPADSPAIKPPLSGTSVVADTVNKTSIVTDVPLTSAQIAAEQRKIRAGARQKNSATTAIQSLVRSRQVASRARNEQRNIFDKRMSDLIALSGILKKSQDNDYIPPPATVSMMVVQFLFFAWPHVSMNQCIDVRKSAVIIEGQDLVRWSKLIKHIILPGIMSDSSDLDPFIPWIDSFAGKRRLTKLLGLCVSSISRSREGVYANGTLDRPSLYANIDSLLRRILHLEVSDASNYAGGVRDEIHHLSQGLLFNPTASDGIPNDCVGVQQSSCDVIQSLRFTLLHGSDGKSPPIPANAEQLRENSIMPDERDRVSILFKLIVDHITFLTSNGKRDKTISCSRFLVEVLTVPLITWKVEKGAYSGILSSSKMKYPPMLDYIHSFISLNAEEVSDGLVDVALEMKDISLTVCPAPPVLCLLTNLIQLGKQCVLINGSNPNKLHFKAAAEYHNFLSNLINAAPLGTFSRRMSAVEWVHFNATSTPVVLSTVVVEQASVLLADSYVRALFNCAIDNDLLETEKVINTRTEKDKSYEKDLHDIGTESVSSLAAREAMVDRNRGFWQGTWAKKLTKSVNALISGPADKKPKSSMKGPGQLMNTSTIARQLANGKGSINRSITNAVLTSEDEINKERQCSSRTYGTIISRWGGGGQDDLVKRYIPDTKKSSNGKASTQAARTPEPNVTALLNVLCFSTPLLNTTWSIVQSNKKVVSDLYAVIDVNNRREPIRSLHTRAIYDNRKNWSFGESEGNIGAVVLLVFVASLSHTLMLLYRACCLDDVHEKTVNLVSDHLGLSLISKSSNVMNDLYSRSSRKLLCTPQFWTEDSLLESDLRRCKSHGDYISLLSSPVCRICPFLVSFKRRLKLFERIVTTNRVDIQGSNENRNLKPGIMVKVMRGRVLEDGLIHLNNLGRNMRQRIVVNYLTQAGTKESGIDVGGLFKEFWTDLSNIAFDPNYALFRVTEGDHQYLHLLTDLSTIDPQLYNNLMFLKTYDGDVSDLCLTFTVANDDFGVSEEPLIANGANVEYETELMPHLSEHLLHISTIDLVAKHHVCDRIKEQSDAFTRGLWEVIDRNWLRIFNEPELQVLISGPSDGKIDVADMKSNARYTGGYSMVDRNIIRFWSAVSSFTPKQQADLLRFVTSCERPPPLGFASMNPPFTIQRVGIMRDGEKLPTASTCFNTLKLPTYSSEKVMKERLLYAIQAGAGFELT
eukprot:scaffold60450_cov51-Cyclotella_meneghiniana.AAC.1